MAAPAQRSKAWTTVYFFFQIAFGQVLLPLLVATFTLSRARRHFTLINLCVAFIISSICQCLLLYAGRVTGPEPNPALCAFQGATVNAVPPLWSTSLFFFVWNLRSQTIDRTEKAPSDAPSNAGSFLTMTLQYFVFLAFLIASAAVATIRPDMASRNWRALYCNLHVGPLNIVSATYTAVLAFTSLVLTVPTAKKLFSIYPWFRNKRSAMNGTSTARGLNLRISAFMLFIAVGFIFSVWSDFDDYGFIRTRDMYLAIAPAVIFLLFGTQKDILEVWCFWRKIMPVRRVPKLTREQRTKVDTESTPDTADWSPEVRLLHEPQSA